MAKRTNAPHPELTGDPLLAALIVLWRRAWLVALGLAAGGAAGWFATPARPLRHVATAQLFIKTRPVMGGERQDPVDALTYANMAQSPTMSALVAKAAAWDMELSARHATTQDTNFGKYYSPLVELELRAPSASLASQGMAAWRENFLALYGDLASRDAAATAKSAEAELAKRQAELDAAYAKESLAEAKARPLLLRRAALERALAPFQLRLGEPLPSRPRAQGMSRDRVVIQDIQLTDGAPEPARAEGLDLAPESFGALEIGWQTRLRELAAAAGQERPEKRDFEGAKALAAEIEAELEKLAAPLAEGMGALRAAQSERVRLEAAIVELGRQAEQNRQASLRVGEVAESFPAPKGVVTGDAADVSWIEPGTAPKLVPPSRSRLGAMGGAAAGALLAAIAAMLSALSRQERDRARAARDAASEEPSASA